MVRFAGWTLQLIVLYLDSNFEIGQGPNKESTEQALQCIMAAKVPWLIIGNFNRRPEEVASSAWCKFLRGVVLTPDVAFTCTNTSQAGGSLIDYAVASRDLAPKLTLRPILHYGFKPHVVSIRVHLAAGFEPDIGRRLVLRHEICERAGPREFDDTWAKHWNLAEAIELSWMSPGTPQQAGNPQTICPILLGS